MSVHPVARRRPENRMSKEKGTGVSRRKGGNAQVKEQKVREMDRKVWIWKFKGKKKKNKQLKKMCQKQIGQTGEDKKKKRKKTKKAYLDSFCGFLPPRVWPLNSDHRPMLHCLFR